MHAKETTTGIKLRIVQKYGGTSVADIARLENVALKVKREVEAGHQVAVVVSAMAGVTNQLVGYTKAFSNVLNSPEHDTVTSTGEQITTGLLSLALQQLDLKSRSFMGWQIPIKTTSDHTNAQILSIDPKKLEACLEKGIIPVIAGFQGITSTRRITTLGRGGSDTTAVAIAAALRADRCDIYTDVDGVYTADPRIVSFARKLEQISYSEMLELAAQGAKVLHSRSVETALKHQVHVRVLSSFNDNPGTDIIGSPPLNIARISGITHSIGWVIIHLETHNFTAQLFHSLRKTIKSATVETDSFSILEGDEGTRISFMVQKADFAKTIQALEKNYYYSLYKGLHIEPDFAKISIIGLSFLGKMGLTEHFLEVIKQINTSSCLTHFSSTRISFGVKEEVAAGVMQIFHANFELDQKNESDTKETMATRL
ncbi:aspartate kinase [Candidatus Paracaedibacter symbiosus]|uniref:aspartate kinase n=1 Tax=Candidatus Paracaedibacter symbiosus TaxID=244582 RepID=UPI00068F6D4D|nr:aspartate kinase [Candidatus Paracaedibacter symbiosus]